MKLPKYLEQQKVMAELFKQPIDLETEAGILKMFDHMSCDLSPENLCCDGELSYTETNRKYREIMTAWKFLEKKLGRKVEPTN